MFTGLIEEIGKINRIEAISGGKRLEIFAHKIMEGLKTDDSVAVNGVCLTVTGLSASGFFADAVGDTLLKTTLKDIRPGMKANLERALKLSDRLGGHLVLGHVNGIARITQIKRLGDNYLLEISIPSPLTKYVISEGSITLDGISLTTSRVSEQIISISVIPHTYNNTNLKFLKNGNLVNIETDVLARYIEKLIVAKGEGVYTDSWFKKLGYE